ncbi:MAG: transglycosylase domain-containing protein, partial [Pseudomonadota bacterium]|nr:transglycosylase domain-containing protein [Pseudomonadota bacterium]
MAKNNRWFNRIAQHIRRHKTTYICIFGLVAVYWIVRLFFIPPLLSDTHFSRAYYDRNGALMRMTLTADDKYRLFTPLAEISPDVVRATVLYEDKYFWYHPGVNPV